MAFTDKTDGSRTIVEGVGAVKVTLGGIVQAGDPIGVSGGVYVRADANNSIYMDLIAGSYGTTSDEITAYRGARIGNITSGTAGARVYLSDDAGAYAVSEGTVSQDVGEELGNSEMWIEGDLNVGGINTDDIAADAVTGAKIGDDEVDSEHYAADSVDLEHLASEVAISIPLVVGPGLFDNEIIELGPVRDACTVVHVTYDTDATPGIGTTIGIDILDGGTNGAGSDIIDSCSNNLSGLDSNELSTPYALSAGDYLRVEFEDFAASTYMTTVTIWLKVPIGSIT